MCSSEPLAGGGRFSECALLLRLVHEYDPVLHPRDRTILMYDEGKLASDLRDWERSLTLLRAVADNADADPELRIRRSARWSCTAHERPRGRSACVARTYPGSRTS
jgi:hypothetical protein